MLKFQRAQIALILANFATRFLEFFRVSNLFRAQINCGIERIKQT
jgi:hypothetical protein